ncbi:MAG TPA: hypothetical protein VF720_05335 [Candidatus Eisenbacteria bacterium]
MLIKRLRPVPGLLTLAALGFAIPGTSVAGPTDPFATSDLTPLATTDTDPRQAAIDHLAIQTRDGLTMLAHWYIQGSMTPLPEPRSAEFMYTLGAHRGEKAWSDAALGATGAWVGLHLNDYLKWGVADSTRTDVPANGREARKVKTLTGQSELLELFTMAFQASGKELFRKAARSTAGDLLAWSRTADGVLAWTSNEPDTLAGPMASDAEMRLADERLARAALVFGEPAWGVGGGNPAPTPLPAPAPPVTPVTQADSIATARSALDLIRQAMWTHADSLIEEAGRRLEPLQLATAPETRVMPLFAARASAGLALELSVRPSVMAYLVGDSTSEGIRQLRDAAVRAWRPGKLVQVRSAGAEDLLYPASEDGKPLAYVCSGELCAPPTSDPTEVLALVGSFALPEAPGAPGQ